ncbi:MAG: STAS domain-containing protein [Candidatus Acidiferrales bacterium]
MILKIEQRRIEPDVVVLELEGKLLMGNESKRLELQVEELLRNNQKKFIFDLSQLTHMDSTGIGIITLLLWQAETQRRRAARGRRQRNGG